MEESPSNRANLVKLLVGVAVGAGLLYWWGGWALPVVIFALLLMIMGHEFGHFITAKRAGMKVTDFFVGFGPVVWSTQIGDTRYGVRAIPAGGYVKVPGMTWTDKVDPADEARTYRQATYPRKVLFASAGSLMHLVMAFALVWVTLTFVGLPSASHVGVGAFTKWQGYTHNAAQSAGLHVGDRILSIDGKSVTSDAALINIVHDHVGTPVTLVVVRAGQDLTLHVTPVDGRHLVVNGAPLAKGSTPQGYIGVELANQVVHESVISAIPTSFSTIGSLLAQTGHALAQRFSPSGLSNLYHQVTTASAAKNPTQQLKRPISIVGAARLAVQGAQTGPGLLLVILVSVNISVGILNILPILPLDGGHVALATYERVRSRRGRRYHADANKMTPLAYGFMTLLLLLFAATLYLDIAHPIANPFR